MKKDVLALGPCSAVITIISSNSGPVVKIFYWEDGELKNQAKASIFSGTAKTVSAATPSDLLGIIDELRPNEALSLGRLSQCNVTFPITTQGRLRDGSITRTKEWFKHSDKAGYMLLDVDTKDLPTSVIDKLGGKSVVEVIHDVVPELRNSARLIRASSSGGIIKPDGSMKTATGFHIFAMVGNQTQSKVLLNLLQDRLWLAGFGYYKISKSGSLLERSLIDTAVHGAERLVFEAAPILRSPLQRKATPPKVFDGGFLDLKSLPDIDAVKQLKQQARKNLKAFCTDQKKVYVDEQCQKIMMHSGISKQAARKIIRQRLKGFELADHDILEIAHNEYRKVSEFLDHTNTVRSLPCPLEGSEYGLTKAYFYPPDKYKPYARIISFAHGNITEFTFERFRSMRGLEWLPKEFMTRNNLL